MYWIETELPGRLGTMARPYPKDLQELKRDGVDFVVSLLGKSEALELGLEGEREECRQLDMEFSWLPIDDQSLPKKAMEFTELIHDVLIRVSVGQTVVVHCRMGIGRASLVAAAVLVLDGATTDEAWQRVSEARGCRVPDTETQRQWIERYAIFSQPE